MIGFLTLFSLVLIASADLTFFTIGDWGSVGKDQHNVATQMATAASKMNPEFFVALGDNFYEKGVTSVSDSQWATTYRNVFSAASLQKPWYAILGNHDHLQNASAQIDYWAKKIDDRWVMEDYWYTKTFSVDQNTIVQIVFIDTIILASSHSHELNMQKVADGTISPEEGARVTETLRSISALADEQLQWIEDTLSSSNAEWLFVAGHYPVFSGGEHGNTDELQQDLRPLLEKYNVDAYLCGHDHTLQHLQSTGVDYFVSGNGAKRGSYSAIPESLFGVVDPGFVVHTVGSDKMDVKYIDRKGTLVYSYQAQRKRFTEGF